MWQQKKNRYVRYSQNNFTPLHISPYVPFYFHFLLSQSRISIYPPKDNNNNNNSGIARLGQYAQAHVYAQEQKHIIPHPHTSPNYLQMYTRIYNRRVFICLSVYKLHNTVYM